MAFFAVIDNLPVKLDGADVVWLPDDLDYPAVLDALRPENDRQNVEYHGTFQDSPRLKDDPSTPDVPSLWLAGAGYRDQAILLSGVE